MLQITQVSAVFCTAYILIAGMVLAAEGASVASKDNDGAVTLSEDRSSFTLANGVISARIEKRSGNLVSLKYRDLDLLRQGRGYWSFVDSDFRFDLIPEAGARREYAISIDPKTNGGARGEISCKTKYGKGSENTLPADLDCRYALGRGEHWIYAYSIWSHPSGYPPVSLYAAHYTLKLNPDIFDYMTIDANRRRVMPSGGDWDRGVELNMKEARRLTTGVHAGEVEHKYDYSAILAETPAYGWSSTKDHVGLWMINPSFEYITGGPTKVELTGHLDANKNGLPTLLNIWLGMHYGGGSLDIAKDEEWTKVVGPFLLYCNSASDHETMWKDALVHAAKESEAWPYAWVSDTAYQPASVRATASGRIAISDPLDPNLHAKNIQVGLTAPDYAAPGSGRMSDAGQNIVDWQLDGKYYQFWSRADADARFTIRNVRPGVYTLRAIADGVPGEFSVPDVKVAAGQTLELGSLEWTPKRYGRTVWEIGIPDRSAAEFRHGDHYWQWGLYYDYPKEFPKDVNFVIGKSDWSKDWNYCQPPRIENDHLDPAPWSITFDMPESSGGRAVLRLGICGSASNNLSASLNGTSIGQTGRLPLTGAMHRDGIRGYWFERDLAFDAALLKSGTNVIKLTPQVSRWTQGILYDYLRLEIDPNKDRNAISHQ
jgi:rhamnogalacturonan endolyase